MPTRRDFITTTAAVLAAPLVPHLALARPATERRLVVVLLRGALDGLAAVAPYGERRYRALRRSLALSPPGGERGALDLDGFFGLHPSLENVHRWYRDGDALVVHAVASPYRERSHFDAQNLLENGTTRPFGAADGWLNRALAAMPAERRDPGHQLGIAVGPNVPLMLRGDHPVSSWAPSALPDVDDGTLERIMDLYAEDELLSTRLAQALRTEAMAPEQAGARGRRGGAFAALAEAAGRFLAEPDGPRVAMLEAGGWDTHANQGAATGALAGRLAGLDRGLGTLRRELGPAWERTAVVVVSEFGRTVRENGTRGSDHGTAGVALLLGGAVAGGRVLGRWPGLDERALHEGRDLRPTTDLRAVLKGVLAAQLELGEDDLERRVFPDSAGAPPMDGLTSTD